MDCRTPKTKHPSRPFNPDIANCFFRAGLIEAWGRGTIKILNECKQAKVPAPVFKYDLSGFVIEFKYKELQPSLPTVPKLADSNRDNVLWYISNYESITIAELAKKIGVVDRTIKRILKQLQTEDKIKRIGSDKVGSWVLIDK